MWATNNYTNLFQLPDILVNKSAKCYSVEVPWKVIKAEEPLG